MGCMVSLYLNSKYPDLFAASLYVSGQWDVNALTPLEHQKFFYITAAGDEKATTGKSELMALFDEDGIIYSRAEWSAADPLETQNAKVKNMLTENTDRYFVTFEKGTVTRGEAAKGNEHMDSFNYAYKLSEVRNWLFEQRK